MAVIMYVPDDMEIIEEEYNVKKSQLLEKGF